MKIKRIRKYILLLILAYGLTVIIRAINIHRSWHVASQDPETKGQYTSLYPIKFLPKRKSKALTKDAKGVYMTDRTKKSNLSVGEEIFYSPITIGLASLKDLQKANELGDTVALRSFLINAEWLKENQDSLGRIPILVSLKTLDKHLKPPWYSALGQGFALSVFSRAFEVSTDSTYYTAAKKTLQSFTMDVEKGGIQSDQAGFGPFLEEYPTNPPKHVLNGFNYALLGLNDAKTILEIDEAKYLFDKYVQVLENKIHEFDLGSWSAYSKDQPNFRNHYTYCNPWYHKIHIVQLSSLYKLTGNEIFKTFAEDFKRDMKGPVPWLLNPVYVAYTDFVWVYNLFK